MSASEKYERRQIPEAAATGDLAASPATDEEPRINRANHRLDRFAAAGFLGDPGRRCSYPVEAARQAGVTDEQIVSSMARNAGFNVAAARHAGYSDEQIIDYLARGDEIPIDDSETAGRSESATARESTPITPEPGSSAESIAMSKNTPTSGVILEAQKTRMHETHDSTPAKSNGSLGMPQPDPVMIRRTIGLLMEPGSVVELRAPDTRSGDRRPATVSGYFSDHDLLEKEALKLSGRAPGIYITLNSVCPDLLARSANKVTSYPKYTSTDKDTLRRHRLLLDFDPVRPAGISASEEEHEAALERAQKCSQWLTGQGWPEPVFADSGNGGHLVYMIDLANNEESTQLVKRVLEGLSGRFSNDEVTLDTSTFNASRISKVYGTLAAKGTSTPDRPHRVARLISVPPELKVVSRELLEAIAGERGEPQQRSGSRSASAGHTPRSSRVHPPLDVEAWCRNHDIAIKKAAPYEDGHKWILEVCPFNPEHNRGEACLIQFSSGAVVFRCQHESCKDKDWKELREQYEPKTQPASPAIKRVEQATADAKKDSQATQLVDIGMESELYHTPDGVPYARMEVNGHHEDWPTNSRAFRESLARTFHIRFGKAPGAQSTRDAIATLDGLARFEGECHPVYVRVAGDDKCIWLDLGNESRQVVKITADEWCIVTDPPVRFRRPPGMLALPTPVKGGVWSGIKPFINIISDADWSLILSWCVAAMRPNRPFPILYLLGEQGSAKSTATRVIRFLIDPFMAPLRTTPHEERDLFVAASNSHVIAYDNVSRLDPWLSDSLCRLATGGGLGTRTLYTDSDETLFDVMRPIIMNGIAQAATRGDFLERAIIVNLESISDADRRDEAGFWRDFEEAWPKILGVVLDGVSAALKNLGTVDMPVKPRLADFAMFSVAAEEGLGFEAGTFEEAYRISRDAAVDEAIDSMAIGPYVLALMNTRTEPWGPHSFAELLKQLNALYGNDARPKDWPGTLRKLSADLKRLAPALRKKEISYTVSKPDRDKKRTVTLSKTKSEDVSADVRTAAEGTSAAQVVENNQSEDVSADVRTAAEGSSAAQVVENNQSADVDDVADVFPLISARTLPTTTTIEPTTPAARDGARDAQVVATKPKSRKVKL